MATSQSIETAIRFAALAAVTAMSSRAVACPKCESRTLPEPAAAHDRCLRRGAEYGMCRRMNSAKRGTLKSM